MQSNGAGRYMDISQNNGHVEWGHHGYNSSPHTYFQKPVTMNSSSRDGSNVLHPQGQYMSVNMPFSEIPANCYSQQYHGSIPSGYSMGRVNGRGYLPGMHPSEGGFISSQRSHPYGRPGVEENWAPLNAGVASVDKHHLSQGAHVMQGESYRTQNRQASSDGMVVGITHGGGRTLSQEPRIEGESQIHRGGYMEMPAQPNMCSPQLEANTLPPTTKHDSTRGHHGQEAGQFESAGFAGPLGDHGTKLTGAERKRKWQKENSEFQKALRSAQAKGSNAVITLRTSKSGKVIQFPTKWQRGIRELMYNHLNWGLRHFADQSEDMIMLIIANIKLMFNYEPYPLCPESVREYCKSHLHSCRHKWRVYWNKNGRDDKKIPVDCDPRVWKEMVAYWGTMEGEKESERGKQTQKARNTQSRCGRRSKRMRVEEMSSREETKELDPSIGVSGGCTSGMTPRRGSDRDDDMAREVSKETSTFDADKTHTTLDAQCEALRDTIQQHMEDQRVENVYIHKRMDEMYSFVKEILEISRTHIQTCNGDVHTTPIVEMTAPNVTAMDKCDMEALGGMFSTTVPETQFDGEEEEAHVLQTPGRSMLNKGKGGVRQVVLKSNAVEATSPLETLLKATEYADHEGNRGAPPTPRKKNDMYVEMCCVEEEECEPGTQRRVSKRRVVHTEKGAEMVGNRKPTGKRPPSKKLGNFESIRQSQEVEPEGESGRSKVQCRVGGGPPKKLVPVPLPSGTEVILRHYCYGRDIVARGRCAELTNAETSKKKQKSVHMPPGSQRVHLTEVLKPHVSLYFPNENVNPPQRHLGQVLEKEIVWWIKDLEVDEDG